MLLLIALSLLVIVSFFPAVNSGVQLDSFLDIVDYNTSILVDHYVEYSHVVG